MHDTLKNIKGYVHIDHYDGDMNLIKTYDFENLVVTTGLQWVAARLNDPVPPYMNYIAVGTNNIPPALPDTSLGVEIARIAVSAPGGSISGQSIYYNATFGPGVGTGGLQEAGIFDSAAAGNMLSRVVYPVINKSASDTVAVTWTITIGN